MNTIEEVKVEIIKFLSQFDYELYSFKFRNTVLEIIIDSDKEISLDEICDISEKISELLDTLEFTDKPYTLDISTAGIEKSLKLEKLDKYKGKYVNIHLINPYKGLNTLEGELSDINDEELIISYKEKTRTINATIKRSNVDKARLAIKF